MQRPSIVINIEFLFVIVYHIVHVCGLSVVATRPVTVSDGERNNEIH